MFSQVFAGVHKFGRGLKENTSPRQKGDWKDLMLMSLSFAVYVHVSKDCLCSLCWDVHAPTIMVATFSLLGFNHYFRMVWGYDFILKTSFQQD